MITLAPIWRDGLATVAHIAVRPDQVPFCGTIGDHFAADEPGCDFHIILRDLYVVGFFKIDRDFPAHSPFAGPNDIGLRGVMVDAREQGNGTGKAAMALLRPYVRARYTTAENLVLTVNVVNPAARAVYLSAGFIDGGELHHGGKIGPQHILRLPLG